MRRRKVLYTSNLILSLVVVCGTAVALLTLWIVHKLAASQGRKSVATLEVLAMSLLGGTIIFKHEFVMANQAAYPAVQRHFDIEVRDVLILFVALVALSRLSTEITILSSRRGCQ
jgi:hypothetical protein